ncbi:MAG: YwbE family protein [Bacteroidetes bacterium]|nr:YwbE family protein [Bacteroidota bacterium]
MDGTKRKNIQVGQVVRIVQKQHQSSGELTEGIVSRILTNASQHPHGIKVKLDSGEVGRVKEILNEDLDELDWDAL